MKALTLQQPWASLLACGAKQYETRSWSTKYRGKIAIHASLKDPIKCALGYGLYGEWGEAVLQALNPGWKPELYSIEDDLEELPTGCIIATAELIDCHKIELYGGRGLSSNDPGWIETSEGIYMPSDNEVMFGDWSRGRYAWEFANIAMLDAPIPAKGHQRIWEWNDQEAT